MHKDRVKQALEDPSLFCSCVLLLLFDNIGPEVVDWEPESIYMQLEEMFGIKVDRLLADKINAVLSLIGTDLYHKSLEAFNVVNSVLNFKYANFDSFSPGGVDDLLWGVTEARLIEGGEAFDKQGFSHDIAAYTAQLLSTEGVTKPPTILAFAEYDPRELDNRDLALASDPILAQTYWTRNDELINGLNTFAVAKLKKLFGQLSTLPLQNAQNMSEKVNRAISSLET